MQIKLTIAYDGTHYFGWQKTKMGPSVQETLEKALNQILGLLTPTEAASRTDRGVHAEGQVVQFMLQKEADISKLLYRLNAVLPKDIRILKLEEAPDDFHPTLQAVSKEYRYCIYNGAVEDPMHRLYHWHICKPLDFSAMERAALLFLGTHNFASFTTIALEDTMRTIFQLQIAVTMKDHLQIRILGDRFLYKMVRRLVGTLVAVGKGNLSQTDISELLITPNRAKAGSTAPAHGLFLHRVHYTKANG